ncbi:MULTISPECIES: hypothetical protein [unclassified Pseudomonas]|uniref:lysozyme inhibitor LprI family protein n=1 Tax=unclassified Pseudomonas TaxID=196821 RepID=UPI002AC942A2|nr:MULTISPECIES: hypothetical protein [unclassified Pseudomonas]MEB0045629.1 hypothetical protein [Pseudomonas sp. Dout3]MEB0095512.1 hypothetical protein [Pseudomonas sp. DC1.2]WPX61094.1 hypothetical protein RHM68_10805 [Pseudomonas sp. DC1.2]
MLNTKNGLLVMSYAVRIKQLIIVLPLLAAALGTPIAHAAQNPTMSGPSFSCGASSNAIERMICNDPALSTRDRTMAILFAASRSDASDKGLSQQQTLQRHWLKTRDKQCSNDDMHTCLVSAYDDRLNPLAVAALFREPNAALAELARQNPRSAPLYEAIYRYATLDDKVDRAVVVEKLIAQPFEALHDKPWASPLSSVKNAHDAASSDKNFSAFLNVVSVDKDALTMPCAALVRRPGLMAVLHSQYAGAIDGHLTQSDCMAMTPRLKALDRLKDAAVATQPDCQGTARFSLAREFDYTLIAVRLHRTDLWKAKTLDISPGDQDANNGDPTKEVDLPHFIAQHQASIRDASDELAAYYSSHFGVPSDLAKEQALSAVSAIIFGAYDLCERG